MKPVNAQLKRLFKTSPITLAFVLFPFVGLALDVKDVPNPRQINGTWVTDMAGILDKPTEAQLNSVISQLESQNGAEIAVVTVPETSPAASPKEFTTTLFNYWKIGKKGKNNGVLFLISKGDRRVEIETGYGVEAILPDAKVGNIIDTKITPKFKQGDFKGGTLAGTKALVFAIENPSVSNQLAPPKIAPNTQITTLTAQPPTVSQEPTQDANNQLWVLLVASGSLIAIAIVALRSRRVFLEPEGQSHLRDGSRVCICANCKKRMKKVDNTIIEPTLSKPEQVAQQLGSVRFEGWKCPDCSQQLTGLGFHRVAYESRLGQFRKCPTCEELTVSHTTQILQRPTEYSEGKRLITDKCHCCDYHIQWEETIPRLPPPPPPSRSSSGGSRGSSWSSGSSGSSWSSGSSDSSSSSGSSGGSFGGGDSGGGGAGGSW